MRLVHEADVSPIVAAIGDDVEMVVLNQLLEACPRASDVVAELAARLPSQTLLVVVYSNADSLPGRILRHNWRRFFDWKAVYFNSENLRSMHERAGLRFVGQSGLNTSYTVTRALDLALPGTRVAGVARRVGLGAATVRVPTGTYVSIFERAEESEASELLSVIVPVFNEADYLRAVLDELLAKQFVIPHEVIVVESNSTDGTREIAQTFEGRPGLQIIYEDRPRGKGAAVRRGLTAATGTIVLIQDADFEYDLDDYDALLEPIVQRRTSFVLGSRSLGLDDWKVRRFARSRVKALPDERRPAAVRADLQRPLPAAGDRREHDVQGLPPRVHRGRRVRSPRASASTSSWRACSSRTATARWKSRSTTSRAASTRARRSTS